MRSVIEKIMGKAFSCCCHHKHKEEEERITERSRLLSQTKVNSPGSNGWQSRIEPPFDSSTDLFDSSGDHLNNNSQNKTVEKELAENLIDITNIGRSIDKSEWVERSRLYEKRVALIDKPLPLTSKALTEQLPEETERHFNPIEVEDFELITYLSERASEAVLNGFKVVSDDSVLEAFKPWTRG